MQGVNHRHGNRSRIRSTHLEIPVCNIIFVAVDDGRNDLRHDARDMAFGVRAGIIGGSLLNPVDNYVEELATSPAKQQPELKQRCP